MKKEVIVGLIIGVILLISIINFVSAETEGRPHITLCVSDIDIKSGDTTSAFIWVKNIGEADSYFDGQVICDTPAGSGSISGRYIDKEETIEMPVHITGINEKEGIASTKCTYTIIDDKSKKSDSCSSTVTISPDAPCDPSTSNCVFNDFTREINLRVCRGDGASYRYFKCDYRCVEPEHGKGKCSRECITNEDCKIGDICSDGACIKKPDNNLITAIIIGAAIIIGIILGFIILAIILKRKKK